MLDAIMAVADGAAPRPRPFGLAEWGDTNDKLVGRDPFNKYVDYLYGLFTTRLSGGKDNAVIIYFDLGASNSITGPSDYKVAGFQKLYDALNR